MSEGEQTQNCESNREDRTNERTFVPLCHWKASSDVPELRHVYSYNLTGVRL
jgi:hypothetical protein